MKRIVWAFAAGLVVFYTPYAGLAKAVTQGLFPGVPKGLIGLEILPAAIIGTILMVPLNLTLLGWWKYASIKRVVGIPLPVTTPAIALSGFGLALIIGSTTVLYTFEGISIVLALILMRGGLLVMGPIVDLVFRRKVRWFSWAAFGLSLSALLVSLLAAHDYSLPPLAALSLTAYLLGYALRTPCMTALAKVKDKQVTLRYFVQEILVTIVLLPAIPAAMAIFGSSPASLALRRGFTTFWAVHPAAVIPVVLIGVFYACHNVFGTLIYLDCRENTFCIPLFCGASFLAGYSAVLLLSVLFAYQAPPVSQLVSSGIVVFALVLLSPVHHKFEDAWAFVSGRSLRGAAVAAGPRLILFVCSGNTCRSPMAAAIANSLKNGIAQSAGITPRDGAPMTSEAQSALRSLAVPHDPPHVARALTPALVESADVIYAMTRAHRDAIVQTFPGVATKTHCLDPNGDVDDPIGGPLAGYETTAARLRELVTMRFDELRLIAAG